MLSGDGREPTRSSACERRDRIEHQRTYCYQALVQFPFLGGGHGTVAEPRFRSFSLRRADCEHIWLFQPESALI